MSSQEGRPLVSRARVVRRRRLPSVRRLAGLARGQRGSTMLLTAISMVVLLGFAALTVDGGYMYLRRAQLQDIADSSALAAASEILSAQGGDEVRKQAAFDAVTRFAARNGLTVTGAADYTADAALGDETGTLAVTFPDDLCEVRVEIALDAKTFFARALSMDFMAIDVQSAAEVIHMNGMNGEEGGLVPLGFFGDECVPGVKYSMTLSPGDGVSGNYGFLDYKPPCSFSEYLTDGYPGTVSLGDEIETLPGVRTGQVRSAIADRINDCLHGCSVTDPDGVNDGVDTVVDITEPCMRAIVVPKIGEFYEANGRSYVTVLGFVKIFIEGYNQSTKVLTGWCLGEVGPDEAGSCSSTACSVRLVK